MGAWWHDRWRYTRVYHPQSLYHLCIHQWSLVKADAIRFWVTRACYEHPRNKTRWNGPKFGTWVHDGMTDGVRPRSTIHSHSSIFASTGEVVKADAIHFRVTRACYEHPRNKTHWNGPQFETWVHDGMIDEVRPGSTIHSRSKIFASTGEV
jgi:hypothetical protein